MDKTNFLYKIENHIAWLTINREAKRNAISPDIIESFHAALDDAQKDDSVRVVCITGAGEKIFCAGADLDKSMDNREVFENYANLISRLATYPKPTVARINGHCLAGGTGFMLACDIVIAKESATFGTPEVNVGLFPMMIGALIFRNVPRKKAMEMIMLGEKLSARQAKDMGMITRQVPEKDFDAEVGKVLTAISQKSPIGMRLGKQAFAEAEGMPLEEAVKMLAGKLGEVITTADAQEGIRAFAEKRQPQFTGE